MELEITIKTALTVFPSQSNSQGLWHSQEGPACPLYPSEGWVSVVIPQSVGTAWGGSPSSSASTGSGLVSPLQFRHTKWTDMPFHNSPWINSGILSTPASYIQTTLLLHIFANNKARNEKRMQWFTPLVLTLGTLSKKTALACLFTGSVWAT